MSNETILLMVGDTRVIVYDDYNSNIPRNQTTIGTVTTQFGNPAPRHGFKLILINEI